MIIFLSILSIFLFLVVCYLLWKITILAKIIFIFEDDLTDFSNNLISIQERLEEVTKIRILMEHPQMSPFLVETLDEIKYCRFLILQSIQKTKKLLVRNYTRISNNFDEKPTLLNRLEKQGIYDPEEDGGINVMNKNE